ncbi:hypothetical protein JXE04_00120 [Patescibacteria group bacterium]|nr:hypothetical protein [Patescibacteria group bacterium]
MKKITLILGSLALVVGIAGLSAHFASAMVNQAAGNVNANGYRVQATVNMTDTNDNGIPDGQEDFDFDGVLNIDDDDYVKEYVNMQDADGDGIPNKDDDDYVAPQDGTGIQVKAQVTSMVGDGSRNGQALRQGEAQFQNEAMYQRVKGKILIKPEDSGRAYYVNPSNGMMRSLGRPADAFAVMREEGLGVSNANFDAWQGVAPENLAGKILLKVEDKGQAYYVNPDTLEMIYLNRPADAFNIMRNLGLGISNADFENCFVTE